VNCRGTARGSTRAGLALAGFVVALTVTGWSSPAFATPTTLPGPAPNQSQINSTSSHVQQVESTLAQEEQQASVLDDRYDTAVQNMQAAQHAAMALGATLERTKATVEADRRQLSTDAVEAYEYGTPVNGLASFFSSSATQDQSRTQYTNTVVGNLTRAENTLQASESRLLAEQQQQQSAEAQAQAQAQQAQSLYAANQQESAATKATLQQVQGQLAQEVAQAAVEEAQAEAAAAARAASAAAAQRAAAAAAAAASVANAVGGSASGAAATKAADQAGGGYTGSVSGSSSGDSAQAAAVQAAESQLGVPYVWGGEQAGVGFDCSGLVQWAWSQAGVYIPRTTETQWPALPHVSLNALEPGDLLFYYNLDGDDQVDHVVMYVGSGPYGSDTIIQAPFTGSTVQYAPLFTEGLIGAGRP
jgi:peptidoglycan DL-endopeptidase CwlO